MAIIKMKMNMRKYILSAILVVLLPYSLFGQALRGSYFLDSSIQRIKMNPAFAPKTNFITIPVLGELSLNVNSNLGPSNFLFPKNGELYTYLNKNVSSAEFKALLPEFPHFQFSFDTDILGTGFYISDKEFVSIGLEERMNVRMDIPNTLFVFLKDGMASEEQRYNLKDFRVVEDLYSQLSVGYRRDLSELVPGLSVGGKVKALFGINRVDMKINNANIYMSKDKWELSTDAEGVIYGNFVEYQEPSSQDERGKLSLDLSNIGLAGWGFAIDLGAEYKLMFDNDIINGVNFSASVTDLGTIFYSGSSATALRSKGDVAFQGLYGINAEYDFNEGVKKMMADFMTLADFEKVSGAVGGGVALTPKAFVGVEAPMLNNLMSVGLLYSYMYGISDLTASYNLKVADIFNVGLNYSFLNTTKALGCILEFVPKNGVAVYLGTDYLNFHYTPQGLPVDKVVMNAKLGIQATFGSKHKISPKLYQ